MRAINAVSMECEITSTSFRIAYLLANHLNRVAEFAGPSLNRLTDQICLSSNSVQRAVGQLENIEWLEVVRRNRRRSRTRRAIERKRVTAVPSLRTADVCGATLTSH
jgi:hypothetical protein